MPTGCIVFYIDNLWQLKKCQMTCVLAEAIKVVNYIKSRPLQSRILEDLCEEVGLLHKHLLFHTEVRWLSRNNVLSRLFSLKSELFLFLMDSKPELSCFFSDEKWLIKFT
ncbi:unnamed protein product [Psylliodes chrysocephalus]|uniref:Zinc finger BED domain-containing protein 5 n=1 Tax=Psylliodes chrysocephalus TaxID=3402493 RepID=A0A9P0D7H0_9CUCU|nr:unnamed protein product [Psylliodes chrysocephala]